MNDSADRPTSRPEDHEPGLQAAARTVEDDGENLRITVALSNNTDRTLHYIAEVRTIRYDADSGRLRIALSDRGREPIAGAMTVLPEIRAIEPQGEASMVLVLPRTIVRLAATAAPSPEPLFEEPTIADATEVEVEVAWSRTPYYPDPRQKPDVTEPPLVRWEEGLSRTTISREGGSTSGNQSS
jgi:hypothetical protein